MSSQKLDTAQHTKACIFCFRTELETDFSVEHIIPESIGGRLVLDQVCKECNGRLGHQVDTEILKLPEILQALEALSIPHNRQGIMRTFYEVQAETPDGLRKVRATDTGFEPLPQQLPDGSLLTPDDRAIEDLRKRIQRDERLKSAGLTSKEIEKQLVDLIAAYEKCKPGESIDWPALGVKLVRRQEKPTIRIRSRDKPQITRFLAKVAYEFLFMVGGRDLLLNDQVSEPLFHAIQGANEDNPAYFMRFDPPREEYKPIHMIDLLTERGLTEVYTLFFGRIGYRVTALALKPEFLGSVEKHFGIAKIIGIHFQQGITNGIGFWAVTADGKYVWLGLKE